MQCRGRPEATSKGGRKAESFHETSHRAAGRSVRASDHDDLSSIRHRASFRDTSSSLSWPSVVRDDIRKTDVSPQSDFLLPPSPHSDYLLHKTHAS